MVCILSYLASPLMHALYKRYTFDATIVLESDPLEAKIEEAHTELMLRNGGHSALGKGAVTMVTHSVTANYSKQL